MKIASPVALMLGIDSLSRRTMVSLHGPAVLSVSARALRGRKNNSSQQAIQASLRAEDLELPPDPNSFLTAGQLQEKVEVLLEWWRDKKNVLCITGAGLSTESGLPDYRGHNGSYHRGHKPMIHDQYMSSEYNRKRYWGRGMVGWRKFDRAEPNPGHLALATLERLKKIGVCFEDQEEFYPEHQKSDFLFTSGQRHISIITQNVDSLHRRAGSLYVTELHGRTDKVRCMSCGLKRDRNDFHVELESINSEWLKEALRRVDNTQFRADGDAALERDDYEAVKVPPCTRCGGFVKPDVVFFGDNVPRHRVARCQTAVDASDGVLVVGSSLAVFSAFRHVRAAHKLNIPIAILNVGETRAEIEGLDVLKIEAPAGSTLSSVAEHFEKL